jgi:hypothetical protein
MAQLFSKRELRYIESALTKDWLNMRSCIEFKEWVDDNDKERMISEFRELSDLLDKVRIEIME